MSAEPFKRLVKLVARAFYDDIPTRTENQPKSGRSDNRGMAVVVLDALTRRQWVKEDDLAKDLKLHSKQLRRTLRFFEEERLITRDHRRETAKGAKVFNAAVAATADGQQNGKEGEEKLKLHTHSYCCLDYAQTYDVVRYRIHRMKKRLKDELEDRNTLQEYVCPNCHRRYSALDALQLISMSSDGFHCENCNSELIAESDKLAAEEKGDGEDNGRRRRREKLRELLEKMEEQLKPLMEQIARVKDLTVPEYGSLLQWEATAIAAGRAVGGEHNTNESSKSSQGQGYGGTPMPYLGETKVEVALSGMEVKAEDSKDNVSVKVLPPWMIKQGMNITDEQRGDVKHELKSDSGSSFAGPTLDRKPGDDKGAVDQNIQEEYIKAYYAAIFKQQQQSEVMAAATTEAAPSERRVGMKAKREEEDDEVVEWEDAPIAGATHGGGEIGNAKDSLDDTSPQVAVFTDDNVPVEEEEEEEGEEDDIDWEEEDRLQ
ncbi:hypothetical protein SUGI_0533660 [Cryptomeria japonica]|nr:hypothetical protein SUGI_0533660 [Cryptomeria japonica]